MAGGPATVPANAVLLSIKRRGRHFRAKWQSSVEFESHACLPACPEPALDTCVSFACVAAARPAAVVPACLGDGIGFGLPDLDLDLGSHQMLAVAVPLPPTNQMVHSSLLLCSGLDLFSPTCLPLPCLFLPSWLLPCRRCRASFAPPIVYHCALPIIYWQLVTSTSWRPIIFVPAFV